MTAKRLQKIANCLASFTVSKKRNRSGDYSEAIADWESDLEYLRRKYYKPGKLGFHWPDVDVPTR